MMTTDEETRRSAVGWAIDNLTRDWFSIPLRSVLTAEDLARLGASAAEFERRQQATLDPVSGRGQI